MADPRRKFDPYALPPDAEAVLQVSGAPQSSLEACWRDQLGAPSAPAGDAEGSE